MGRGTKSTELLKECMADALIKLMHEKPLAKITIQEIVDLAEVGRATYFRNFGSKNEVLTFKLVKLWERWSIDRNVGNSDFYSLDTSLDFFEFNYYYRDIIDTIYASDAQLAIFDAAFSIIHTRYNRSIDEAYVFTFLAHGLFGLLDAWVANGYKETPYEMAKIVVSLGNYAATEDLKAKKISEN